MKASDILKLYVAVWSEKQQAFHVETVEEMLQRNLASYYHDGDAADSDWLCVGFADSHREASSCIRRVKAGMDLRKSD